MNNENTFPGGNGDFEPQRPFTEKNTENNAENNTDNRENTAESPDVNNASEQFAPKTQSYEHPPVNGGGYAPSGQYPGNAYQSPAQNYTDYSNPINYNAGYNGVNRGNFGQNVNPQYSNPNQNQSFNQNPNPNTNPNPNPSNPYSAPYAGPQGMPYAQYQPMPPQMPQRKKTNGGIIALIVVLSSLLVLSFVGLVVFLATSSRDSGVNGQTPEASFEYTVPNFTVPEQTMPQPEIGQSEEHKESDYSNKTIPNYKGLTLNDKPKDAASNNSYSAAYASSKVAGSVVGVVCYSGEITTVEDCSSQGSGIVISADGYVITNSHVIGNSKTAYLIQIVTSDGKAYKAGVVGFDSRTDLALLKMDGASGLKAATFGDSDKTQVGEDIIVVGNPGGLDYQNTTTKGVVSAVNRDISPTTMAKYIQTDAAINPGNSGGPLVNIYGQVIGVATSKIVSEKYEGMGFAIPSRTVKEIVDSLMRNGYIDGRVKIGISGYAVDAATASANSIPQGIYVQEISDGGPCDSTDLQPADIIIEADGEEIKDFSDIYGVLENHKPGDKIKLKYYRSSDGSEGEIEVTLQEDK